MRKKITDSVSRIILFTIGGVICLGSYEVALRMFGVLLIVNAIGNELNTKTDEN